MPPTDATVVPVRGPLSAGRSEAVVAGTTRSLSPAAGELLFWAAHLAFWMLVLAASLVIVQVFRPAITDPVPFVAVRVGLCFAATAAMRWLSRQEPLLTRLGLSKIGLVAGGSLLSAVLITLTLFWVDRACALYFGYQLIRERNSTEFRAMQAESLALKNELEHLQGQISPHFLFNALNTVLACRQDPEAIDTVTQALANYLRFLLRPVARLEPLSRELDALEQYLTVQGVRFGDGLVTRIECDLDVRNVAVPPVMVQPLVENAIKYGGQTADRPIRVDVTARRDEDWLAIEVANSGRWVAPGGRQSTGTGLRSLERRLRLLVGPSASVSHRQDDGWVRVLIRVPLGSRSEGPEEQETWR